MIFPLWKFWTYSPAGFFAALIWNTCELLRIPAPFAPQLFGLVMGRKARKHKPGDGGADAE